MAQQGNDVEKLYNALKRDGYDDLGTLDEFSSRVKDRDKANKLYEAMLRDGYDDLGTADDFYGRLNPQPTGYTPSAEELAGFQRTIGQAQQTVAGSQQAAQRISRLPKTVGLNVPQEPVKVGQNSKVRKGEEHFNLDTGQMESTYITEAGNEYSSRAGADIEQNAVDLARHQQTLPGQLQDAYAERERLNGLMEQRRQQIEAEKKGESGLTSFLRAAGRAAVSDKMPDYIGPDTDWERDSEYATLASAYRQNEQRITALEAERDDDGGTQFWRGFMDAAKNPGTLTFGLTDFKDMAQLMNIKAKIDNGEEITENEEAVLRNTMANGVAQQMFGENRGFMYRAGGIAMQALPFVAEFVGTGGFSTISHAGATAGTRIAEKLALEGLKKTLLRNTGLVMGDIASGFVMANTTGAMRTGADIMERNLGHVTMDDKGQYQFEGGKGLGRSIYEGEVANMLEYYTEKLGEHLHLGQWIAKGAEKMGLSKLSKVVNYLSSSKALEAGGIQDYPSEVVEEQANLLLNAILVGDNNFSTDPNSKEWNQSVFNPKTQLDIWGGMMFSLGLMQSPRLAYSGYNAAGYYAYKHTVDVADGNAGIVFGQDRWNAIKEQIDACDNEHMGELLSQLISDGMNSTEQIAATNYAGDLLKMRGYNMGMMADVRGGEDFEGEQSFLSHGMDQGYQQGHEATEPDDKKTIIDEANAAESALSELLSEQDIQWITNTDPMDAINVMLSNRGTEQGMWNDDEISAVVDYYQKQARAQGVMDAAADDIEYQVARANAETDANTHKESGNLISVESGGEQYYLVGGDLVMLEDGSGQIDLQQSGDAMIVRNAQTGEISVMSPQRLQVVSVMNAGVQKQLDEQTIRQQLTQQHQDEITFGSPAQETFQLNDTVALNDGQGNVIEGEIAMMPSSVDGAYVVYTADGRAMQLTADDLNRMIVAHNGMEVQRSTFTPAEAQPQPTEQGAGLDNATGESAVAEDNAGQASNQPQPTPEQPQSAMDRIPYLQDESGEPILNKKGKKQYQWHKASVEDTAAALTETTGGDMLMARDTATDLVNTNKEKLEKIRKQKPKGDDPIELAESRTAIKRQEQEQQAVIKHWQAVNQYIQGKMREEEQRRISEREAAKSEEQRQQEAKEREEREARQNEIDRQRLREAIEKEHEKRNKEYEPLVQARREFADDADAQAILQDTEPRSIEEWVSSLLRPHSILWQDASQSEIGLRSELGLQRQDMQRFMTLLGNKENGAKPFGRVALDIHEGLPEGLKEQYTDHDVRNILLELFQTAENSRQMMNLIAENRIAEAQEYRKNQQRLEAEWEMQAWCEAYHLTEEERATFEDFMQQPPMEPEQAVIDNLIAQQIEDEQNRRSEELDSRIEPARNDGESDEGQEPVQQTGTTPSDGDNAQAVAEGAEAATGQPPVAPDNVPSGTSADREAIKVLFDQIGASPILSDRMSDYEVEQLTAMVDDWDDYNDKYGQTIEKYKDNLRSKVKEVREAAQQAIDTAQSWANQAFEPVEQYIEELNTKYGIENEEAFEGAIPTPGIDEPRFKAIREALTEAYRTGDQAAIQEAAAQVRQYVSEGLSDYQDDSGIVDIAEDYDGNDPAILADQYIVRVFWNSYLDDDADQEYINTGLKPSMRQQAAPQQEERTEPYTSFEELAADSEVTVTDPAMQKALREIVDKVFAHGSSNSRRDPLGFDYRFVYLVNGVNKADKGLLKPWYSDKEPDYNDDSPTAQWIDEAEQRIYFIKFQPSWSKISEDNFIVAGWKEMSKPIGTTSTPQERASEEAKVDTNPTDAQKEAGNYQKGHIKVDGYDISIENPKGTTRSGTDASGKSWSTTMQNTYGYIRGTEGVDGDHIDVFLSDNPTGGSVYVVDQINPSTSEFDEHKVMYGFNSLEEARQAYLANYEEGWQGLGNITEVSREDFKKWIQSSHRKTKPFAEYKSLKKEKPAADAAGVVEEKYKTADDIRALEGKTFVGGKGETLTIGKFEGKERVKAVMNGSPTTFLWKHIAQSLNDTYWEEQPTGEPQGATEPASTPKTEKQPKKERQHKRIVSDDQMEELRKQLLAKFGQANAGLDMERMLIGAAYAVAKIERGVTKFADFCADMVEDFGDVIRPYLKLFYNGARDLPEASELRPLMDDAATVEAFDVYNFDKGGKAPDVITKAQQVTEQQKVKKQAKKIEKETKQAIQKGVQQLDLFADMETNAPETETKPAKQEIKPAKQEIPAAQQPLKLRAATDADIDNNTAEFYYQGKRVWIMLVTHVGEQVSATQFSKPRVDSVTLTNGKNVKLSDLQVKDDVNGKPVKEKKKMPWWNDANRPASISQSDYRTYMTDEAREYFASYPAFDGWKRKELAFVTAAVWDGVVIPYEALKDLPEIVAAEQIVNNATAKGVLQISDEERDQHAQHLLDAEHGSAVFENGKIRKVNGVEDFSGPVHQERKALVIIGYPAAGKSSVFANRLSNEHGARIIDSDVVKPWLEGFDGGNGAGYVQSASSEVAERAIDIAVGKGDNIIMPRIGGGSVIMLSAALRLAGYDVQLYFNDVATVTSVNRATSRFAETGRYLSLQYLTSKDGVPSKNFRNFAENKIGDYINELSEGKVQELRGRLGRLLESETVDGKRLWESSSPDQGGYSTLDEYLSVLLGTGGTRLATGSDDLIFSYAEWKSNDVAFGEKPKEIWNSKSGKPLPGTEKKVSNEGEQKVSREPKAVGQGAEQASGATERAGAQRSPESNRAERSGSEHSVETTQGVTDGGEARGSSVGPSRVNTGSTTRGATNVSNKNRRNNAGERGKDYAPLSPKARFNANVEAIRLMRQLVDEGVEAPTKEQMAVLRQYSGWGGMGTFFNDESSAENKLLRDLLSDEEYNDAALSIKTAYYTPATVIDTLWDIAKAIGFKSGRMLEGSAGIGNIIAQMPKDMSSRSDIEAVELDSISGNILKLLYPDAKVHIKGFQDVQIPNASVDLAITNVPFAADISVIDKVDKDLSRQFRTLHDFCIAKNIRKLKEGGIGIFISTSGTLDKSTKLREWITDAGQTDVIGAFRLHNKTFGGANVTSDIIVVRKRIGGVKSPNAIDISKATPLRVGTYQDKFGNEHQASMVINDYFREHPEMMAGEMFFGYEKGDTYRPGSYGLYPVDAKQQEKMLADFAKGMKEETAAPQQQNQQEPVANQLTAEKEGRMLVDDKGRLCVSERGVAVPLQLNATKVKGYTKEHCFKDYQAVQMAVDDALQQQLSDPDDAALEPKLQALNAAYDRFVKRYGHLHKNTSIAFLRNDIDFPSFLALENYSESKDIKGKVTVTTRKAPLFSQRVLGFKTEPKPKTVKDAVIASIFRSNGIDLDWIAERLNDVAAPPNGENWTVDDVRKGILVSRLGFEDPSTGQLEIRYKYLSGNVREKLAIAEAYNTDGQYAANIEELRKVIPMDIPAHLIDFSLGSSWIPMEIYTDYLKEYFDLDSVKLAHLEGSWVLDEGYGYRNEKNRAAGIYSEQFRETIYGHQLVAAALNNRPVKVQKQVSEGYGSSKTTRTVTDQAATQACAVRVDEIKDEFKAFAKKKMQDNPELAAQVEKIYNEKFNALVPMQIDDDFLPEVFEGANMNIRLYGHQKRGVMRGLTAPTMLAHEVGTGKSFTLISTAMEMKRLGTAKKPMIVVQNATVAQMTADAKLLYPNARVLSLSEKDRSAEGRRSFYAKIKFNDWDIIIVPQSTFERIPDSPERELQFIQEKIDEKKHVIEAAEAAGTDSREIQRLKKELQKIEQEYGDTYLDRSDEMISDKKKSKKKDAKQEAASLEKAKTKAQEQLDRAVDDVQYFDDLGVDALLVDEAHEYKHLGFQTSIGRGIKGIDPSYSKKCAGLYNKTRSVFEKAGWKNVVFATGTPISNTAAEIWTFMKYLMPADVMRANDIYYFDDFVHNFGNISQMLEFATSGKFKENTRFAAYVNKPELIRIWSQVADTVLTKEVGAVNEKIPDMEGGKDQDMFLPQSPSLIRIMNAVRKELERFENMTGKEKKENSSIPLTMYGIAKRAAIDPRLVDATAPDEPLSKTNAAVKEIIKDLEATKDYKGTVAVFCDNQNRLGKSLTGKAVVEFNIYDEMKAKLIAGGVPESQIAIIKSGMSITAKQKIFDAVNSGDIRVVLGSTQTLGTGVNMQERLHLLIHMDAPDRPMDYTQRNGRIKRQGNLHKTWGKSIRVIRFGVEDSLDVTAYQRLKTKSGFIDSIMDGKGALLNNQVDRTVEEEEEGLFDNPVAVLSGSQYALKKNQAERELRKYQGKKAQWEADQVYVANALRHNKNEVEATQGQIEEEEKQLAHIKQLFPDGTVKTITIEGVKIDMTKGDEALGKLTKTLKEKINDPVNEAVKKLRENQIYNDEVHDYSVELDGHKIAFKVFIEREAVYDNTNGRMRTVVHKSTTYESKEIGIEALMKSSSSVGDRISDIMDEVVTGRDYTDRIESMKAKIERIKRETEQLQQRVGMEFQFDKELEEAKKNVEEYTELMKKEMAEKEAKYAAQQAAEGDGGFDLRKAEDSEEEDDGTMYRADEDELSEHVQRVADALEADYPGFSDAFLIDEGIETRQAMVWVNDRDAAMKLYKDYHPDAKGDYYFATYMWGRELFEDKMKDPSLQDAPNELPDFAQDAEQQRPHIIGTEEFKGFFGDWQNDPEHASKVLDADGKPLILYHGTNLTNNNQGKPFWVFYPNSHFGTIGQSQAMISEQEGRTKTYPVYLNIRNPKRVDDTPEDWEGTHSEWWHKQVEKAMKEGYDGIVYLNKYEDRQHPADSWIAFYPWQVKSAQENIGTYDPYDPDIRHRGVEKFREGELFTVYRVSHNESAFGMNVRHQGGYMTDLLPDEYQSKAQLLDALRRQYPDYWVSEVEGADLVRFESWNHALRGGQPKLRTAKQEKAHSSYINRKTRNAVMAVSDMARRLNMSDRVDVLYDTEGLTGKKARSKGWFNPKTGRITIVLPNHTNQADVVNTLLHEGVAHFGLRQLFGNNFETFLDNVYNNVAPQIKARIDAAIKRNGWSQHEATEEYLARLAERTDFDHASEQGWWQKIKDFFFELLGQAGFNIELSDNDLRYILWRSHENLRRPNSYRDLFDHAKEVQMQRRLGIERYTKERERLQRTGRIDVGRIAAEAEPIPHAAEEYSDAELLHSIRTKEPPKKTGVGYKVFKLGAKDHGLYPPKVANADRQSTPIGMWLDADAAPIAKYGKTGRPKVASGGKGTAGGSGPLAYRPGWHLGEIPYALQFNRGDLMDNPLGLVGKNGKVIQVREYFPNDFVWAEVEYADDVDYQKEAESYGYTPSGNFDHALAGLPRIPEDGSYKYRTNPNPATDAWIITGAMRVKRILTRAEVDELVRGAGREPQQIEEGDIVSDEIVKQLNDEIQATMEADEMGLLYRDDDSWEDDLAKDMYEKVVAKSSTKWQEAWQDSMIGLKAIQDAIAAETGNVASGAEDAYHYENRMHGRAKNMTERYDWQYYRPMLKAFADFCKEKGLGMDIALEYLVAKSGLERNMYYAMRDGARAKVAEDIKQEREKLEKDYARGRMTEDEYKLRKQDLELKEQEGPDELIDQIRTRAIYINATEDYENGDISYGEYLRRKETAIRAALGDYYDTADKDMSGLTETFTKELYDAAQEVKKQAQKVIDPDERRALWKEYDSMMRDAYTEARQVAEDAVFGAEDGAHDSVKELWERINAATKETLRHSYESGLIDKKNYEKVQHMFDYYIPLRGWDEDKASDVYTYMGKDNVFSPAVKKTWGRTSKAENPLAYIGNIAVSTILSGHRNLMKQHFLNYVMNNPTSLVSVSESWYENIGTDDAPMWILRSADTAGKSGDEIAQIVSDFNDEMAQKQSEGKAMPVRGRLRLDVHATSGQKTEHVVEVQRAGRTYQLYINSDPKAAQALNGSAARAVSRISDTYLGKQVTRLNRSMAAYFTSKNPAFVVSNLSRDLNMAGASVAINEGAVYNARFVANVMKVLSPRIGESSKWVPASKQPTGLMPSLMRKWQKGTLDERDETERLFKEFMEEGGETGFVNMLSVDSFKDKMINEIAQMNGSSFFGSKAKVKETKTGKGLRMIGDIFEFYNRCAEDATRFIVYMTSRQMGKTLEESIADAKDVTLNFNRKGTGALGNAEVRDLFIFVNPAIQALANMYRMAKGHPLKFGAVTAAFVAGGALMPIVNQWLMQMFGDDDDKNAYWNLPPWVRKNNFVMWVPGTKNFITIPLAQEFRVFYGVGEMMSSMAMDHPVDKWGLEIFSSVADLVPINPTGNGGNLMVDFAPTMVQPLMQIGENVDFTGRPIWRENQGNKYAPMYTKAYVSTPKWMVKVSEGLNGITGGNEGKKGALEEHAPIWGNYVNNPAVWNHLLQGYFGGMYNTIAKTFDVGVTAASGELPKVYQTPIINRFLNRPVERDNGGALGDDYYSLIEERDKTMYEVRTWKKKVATLGEDSPERAKAQEKLDELTKSERYRRAEVISHYEKIIKDLKAGERAINEGAAHEDSDKRNIQQSMQLYKTEMLAELASAGDSKDALDAIIEKYDKATSLAEKNKLRLRIERMTMQDANGQKVGRSQDVEKALAYVRGEEVESKKVSDLYMKLASGKDIADDARIRAAKARIKKVTDEYKRLMTEGKGEEAAAYREAHSQWFAADNIIKSQQRGITTNKKLLGKGYDSNIMKLIATQRQRILDAIEGLE